MAVADGTGLGLPRRRTWRDRLLARRDRLLASAGFQRWASAFPLTRPVARRRVRELFDLCAGFVYSQVLYACVRLGLLETLEDGPLDRTALGARVDLPAEGLDRLLEAAISLRLVERRRGGRFGLGPLGAAMVRNPGIKGMVDHHAMLYADLADPVALLRGAKGGGELERYWGYARGDDPRRLEERDVAAYSDLMAASQSFIAEEVIAAYPFARHRRLLDVGGGDGTFLRAVAAAVPTLELHLFDLPAVAATARRRFAAAGVAATAHGGSFLDDALPAGADLVTLVRVVHDHDDESVLTLLRAVRRAIAPDGTLLLAEPMAGTRGAEPIGSAYFGFYLWAMGSGRARTPDELRGLLARAGFGAPRERVTHRPLLVRLMEVRPAEGTL
ncbi:MAG: methyltransferase [Alphaproteobacteria bacterium]|jgi:demethylspheroidene O-methyltransferase|nr:methyltransferase [Alphaproteobacteria bacterium]